MFVLVFIAVLLSFKFFTAQIRFFSIQIHLLPSQVAGFDVRLGSHRRSPLAHT